MNIFKENYEKFILSIVLFAAIFGLSHRLRNNYKFSKAEEINSINFYKLDIDNWNGLKYSLGGSKILLGNNDTVFSFDKTVFCPYNDCHYIINSDSPRCNFCGRFIFRDVTAVISQEDSDGDGISNQEEFFYKLNPYLVGDVIFDNDNDGFLNRVEIGVHTDPNDINDYPPLIWTLSFIKSTRSYLRIVLKSVYTQDGKSKEYWEVSMSVKGKSGYYKLNDEVYQGYKIVDIKYESYFNEKGKSIRKIAVVLQKKGEEAFEIYPNRKVYPPKSRKYYFAYKLRKQNKTIVVRDGEKLLLKGADETVESYDILKYNKKANLVIFSRLGDYYPVKKNSLLDEEKIEKKGVDASLKQRTTL